MILKREVKDGIVKGIYESSNILASEYDQKTNDLTVVFNYGGKYKYTNVSKTDYTRFEMADSQGKVLNSHIKSYSYTNLGKVDVQPIKEEVIKAKEDDIKAYQQTIVLECQSFEEFSEKGLASLERAIQSYKNKING